VTLPTEIPPKIKSAVESRLGVVIVGARPLGGGAVNHTVRLDFVRGRKPVFLKWHPDPPAKLFEAEADGLQALAATGAVRVPTVQLVSGEPAFLIMEYIPTTEPRNAEAFSRKFAAALAQLHRSTTKTTFGYTRDNFLGSQPQRNVPSSESWVDFYRDYRLMPQIDRARTAGLLTDARESALMKVVGLLDGLFNDMPPEASLIHGDLWSGNFLCSRGEEPLLIDPAVHYAPREMEIAYVELFGGFPPNFLENYQSVLPLDEGYARRRSLHQLYPLLIHLNHFGEEYGPAVDKACAEYLK
jgi:fructosamine-3-kinase